MLFDQAFKLFFRKRGYIEQLIAAMLPEGPRAAPKEPPPGAQRIQEALFGGLDRKEETSEVEIDARLTVSDREILQKKDFAQMTAAEIAAAKDAIARLALPMDLVRTRRLKAARHGHMIDVRRTFVRQHESRWRGDRSEISRPAREGAADRGAARYFRLDEPIHAAVSAFPARASPTRASASPPSCSARGSPTSRAPSASAIQTRRSPPARRMSRTGRAARASPPRCASSTRRGGAACSGRARWCC